MAAAVEDVAGVGRETVALKWPNDLAIVDTSDGSGGAVRKLGGVLGETSGLGTADPTAIVGIGVNVDWRDHPIPADLVGSMTSLADLADGRPVSSATLLTAFVDELEPRVRRLRAGAFDAAEWQRRQLTTDRVVEIEAADGERLVARGVAVDDQSGALVVADGPAERRLFVGEIVRVRLAAV
jgi:biotin-(acetyl-CoA carboxylase) ligase